MNPYLLDHLAIGSLEAKLLLLNKSNIKFYFLLGFVQKTLQSVVFIS